MLAVLVILHAWPPRLSTVQDVCLEWHRRQIKMCRFLLLIACNLTTHCVQTSCELRFQNHLASVNCTSTRLHTCNNFLGMQVQSLQGQYPRQHQRRHTLHLEVSCPPVTVVVYTGIGSPSAENSLCDAGAWQIQDASSTGCVPDLRSVLLCYVCCAIGRAAFYHS